MLNQLEQQLKRANPQAYQEFQKAKQNNEDPNEYLNKVVNNFNNDQKEQWKEQLTLKARTVIANALNNKDENTAKWYLERKAKNEFSTKVENETTINGIETALVVWK